MRILTACLGLVIIRSGRAEPEPEPEPVGPTWKLEADPEINCSGEEDMQKIQQKTMNGQCVKYENVTQLETVSKCHTDLWNILVDTCKDHGGPSESSHGSLLYCMKDNVLNCCFHKAKCAGAWDSKGLDLSLAAEEYLRSKDNKSVSLKRQEDLGFDKCHHLGESLDSTVCQTDCLNSHNSTFAQACRSKKGFFKCCVRRSSGGCHECRFCCSMFMCSFSERDGKVRTEISELMAIRKTTSAAELYFPDFIAPAKSYENFGCLNPRSHDEPEQWGTYDPQELNSAMTEEELESVKTYKYERMFENYEDPQVIKELSANTTRMSSKGCTAGISLGKERISASV